MVIFYHYTSEKNIKDILKEKIIKPQKQQYLGNKKVKDNECAKMFFLECLSCFMSPGAVVWLSTSKQVHSFSNSNTEKGKVLLEITVSDEEAKNNIYRPHSLNGICQNIISRNTVRVTKKPITIIEVTQKSNENGIIVYRLMCSFAPKKIDK